MQLKTWIMTSAYIQVPLTLAIIFNTMQARGFFLKPFWRVVFPASLQTNQEPVESHLRRPMRCPSTGPERSPLVRPSQSRPSPRTSCRSAAAAKATETGEWRGEEKDEGLRYLRFWTKNKILTFLSENSIFNLDFSEKPQKNNEKYFKYFFSRQLANKCPSWQWSATERYCQSIFLYFNIVLTNKSVMTQPWCKADPPHQPSTLHPNVSPLPWPVPPEPEPESRGSTHPWSEPAEVLNKQPIRSADQITRIDIF